MEVLLGNQKGPKTERRRTHDQALGDNRALSWGSLDSDILLKPHSPLAIADILMAENGIFDLMPNVGETKDSAASLDDSVIDTDNAKTDADIPRNGPIGIASRGNRRQRALRDRANLLSSHNNEQLLKQCKKNLVENALIKSKGDRQLYIAAGFISWNDNAGTNKAGAVDVLSRAPLLLFPALLVRIPGRMNYEVRLAGEEPEFNRAFAEHAEHRFGQSLPFYQTGMALNEFFAQVAESIQLSDQLTLEFDVALGSASLMHKGTIEAEKVELPDVPANFDIALAMSIANNKSLLQLNAVLQLIPDYGQADTSVCAETRSAPMTESVAGLRKYAAKLAAEGLDHVEFRQLFALPSMMNKWAKAIDEGLATRSVTEALGIQDLTARELIRLSSIIELIDKAPGALEHLAHGDLCYANSTLLLLRAQHQSKLIEDELAALQEHFVLDKVPSKSQLLSLMAELGGTIDSDKDLVDSDYFGARRQFMEFSVQKPSSLTADHRRTLSQLVKVLRFRELFVNNTEYRSALGPGYKGLRTDWAVLTQTSDYARELAEVLESEKIAALIVNNWQEFRSCYGAELDILQNAADGCRRLLGVVGTQWHKKSVSSLQQHAMTVGKRLSEWREAYGVIENHADKTPAMVLSSFSGKSREDVVVEAQVDDTRSQINQQLESGEISRAQISDTLRWLLLASSTASENELDIDAIVDHLQIA